MSYLNVKIFKNFVVDKLIVSTTKKKFVKLKFFKFFNRPRHIRKFRNFFSTKVEQIKDEREIIKLKY